MPRRSFGLSAALCVLVAVAYAAHPLPRLGLHFLLNQVCHGVSAGKAFFALAFALAVFLRLALSSAASNPAADAPAAPTRAWRPRAAALPLGAAIVGMAGALASHLLYVRRLDLPLDWAAWHWRDGLNSVSSLTHTHTSKAPIAALLEALGLQRLHGSFDTGAVFLDTVPIWLTALIGAAFLVTTVAWVWLAPRWMEAYPQQDRPAAAWVLALAAGAASKCVLDGGLLAYDAAAAVATLAVLAEAGSISGIAVALRRRVVPLVLGLSFWAGTIALLDLSSLPGQAGQLYYRLSLYGLIVAWPLVLRRGVGGRRSGGAVGVAVATGAAVAGCVALEARTTLWPLLRQAPTAAVVYEAGGTAGRLEPTLGRSVAGAYRALGENPYRVRRLSMGERVAGEATGLVAEILPLEAREARFPGRPDGVVTFRKSELIDTGAQPRIRVQVEFDARLGPVLWRDAARVNDQVAENERFVAYHLLDVALRRAGFTRYVLVPYAFYRRPVGEGREATEMPPASASQPGRGG